MSDKMEAFYAILIDFYRKLAVRFFVVKQRNSLLDKSFYSTDHEWSLFSSRKLKFFQLNFAQNRYLN